MPKLDLDAKFPFHMTYLSIDLLQLEAQVAIAEKGGRW
jgi:hypothetical protein